MNGVLKDTVFAVSGWLTSPRTDALTLSVTSS